MSNGIYMMGDQHDCHDCGEPTRRYNSLMGYRLCEVCQSKRDRAYDDYVDPAHWYHQHDPERMCEG